MTPISFAFYFFIAPVLVGAALSCFVVLDNPNIKPFKVNMRANVIIFALALCGVGYIILNEKLTLAKDWITPGGFLAVATVNLSLGLALAWRGKRVASSKQVK